LAAAEVPRGAGKGWREGEAKDCEHFGLGIPRNTLVLLKSKNFVEMVLSATLVESPETLSGYAAWPTVADAVIEATIFSTHISLEWLSQEAFDNRMIATHTPSSRCSS